jgi:hypothetical protein
MSERRVKVQIPPNNETVEVAVDEPRVVNLHHASDL